MIDIIDFRLGIREAYQVFDDLDHITLGEGFLIEGLIQVQFAVDLVTAYFAEVIPLDYDYGQGNYNEVYTKFSKNENINWEDGYK